MPSAGSRVTIHMASSLDAFIARKDGRIDWMETSDRNIWFVGGGSIAGECLRRGLADELRDSILPVLIGDGVTFFERLDRAVALHLRETRAYRSGMVALHYDVARSVPGSSSSDAS